jgi:hypothetical protein
VVVDHRPQDAPPAVGREHGDGRQPADGDGGEPGQGEVHGEGAAGADQPVAVEGADAAVVLEPAVVVGHLLVGELLTEGGGHHPSELVAVLERHLPDLDVHGHRCTGTASGAHLDFS